MKHILLKPKRSIIPSDHTFLAKVPLIPNQYIWKNKQGKLALLKAKNGNHLLLLTNQEGFLEQYNKYYQLYFDTEELEPAPNLDTFDLVYGEHGISQAFEEDLESEDEEENDDLEDDED